jgi:rhodanese-related sulfurtransferase
MDMKRRPAILILTLFFVVSACSSTATVDQQIADVSPAQAATIIEQSAGQADFAILDIRTPEEFAAGKIEGSINIDFYASDFREQLDALDKDTHYLVYCNSGNRSGQSLSDFRDLGFTQVDNLESGIQGWYGAGYPVVP